MLVLPPFLSHRFAVPLSPGEALGRCKPGGRLGCGGGFGWGRGNRPHFRVVLSRQRTVPCLMVRFSWDIDINDPLQDKDDNVENLVEVHAMATQPMRS